MVERLRKLLEVSANIGILVVSGLLVWALIGHGLIDRKQAKTIEGVTLSQLPGYNWASRQETMVLAIRSGCHFCEESLPFYRRLAMLEKNNQLRAHLLAVMPDSSLAGVATLKSADINMDAIYGEPLDNLKVTGTPTILLVNDRGRVMREWVGELTMQRENDVISAAQQ
jgi:hypothetical protein